MSEQLIGQIDPSATIIGSSNDLKIFTMVIQKGNKFYVTIGGRNSGPYDAVLNQNIEFSEDSKHFTYVANLDGKWFVVLDDSNKKDTLT